MVRRKARLAAVGIPMLALLALTLALVLGASMASATSTLTRQFCNSTGRVANDLHISFNTAVTVTGSDAFLIALGGGTSRINLSNGTVNNGACTTISVSGAANQTSVKRWWWTSNGNRLGPVVALLDTANLVDLAETPLLIP